MSIEQDTQIGEAIDETRSALLERFSWITPHAEREADTLVVRCTYETFDLIGELRLPFVMTRAGPAASATFHGALPPGERDIAISSSRYKRLKGVVRGEDLKIGVPDVDKSFSILGQPRDLPFLQALEGSLYELGVRQIEISFLDDEYIMMLHQALIPSTLVEVLYEVFEIWRLTVERALS